MNTGGAITVRIYSPDLLPISVEAIGRRLGLASQCAERDRWFSAIDAWLPRLRRLLRPQAILRLDAVRSLAPAQIELESQVVFRGAVGGFLEHAQFVAAFVATIGPGLETLSRRWLRRGAVMRGMIADAVASTAVEDVADLCQADVRAWATPRRMDLTPRYSPGYCGMDVREQLAIFALLPAEQIGVRLAQSLLMIPIKSASGLIGVGPAERVGPQDYFCRKCSHPNCTHRRADFEAQSLGSFNHTLFGPQDRGAAPPR